MTAHGELPALARAALDRRADERSAPGLLAAARGHAATRVLVVRGDSAPVGGPGRLHWTGAAEVADGAEWAFLGRDADGSALLIAVFGEDAAEPISAPAGWARLRAIGGALAPADAAAFVTGLSLGRWLLEAPYCPACGERTDVESAGWSRRCPRCGREHFPRTDPAVIVAVTSADRQRLLLGSNALWEQDRFSCFAGFVEAGESLEAAVAREVAEECGVHVAELSYRGSQAWPYPRSLMLGFHARALDDEAAQADGAEIVQVRWFTRDEIAAALIGGTGVKLPGTASIAHRLISEWHEGAP